MKIKKTNIVISSFMIGLWIICSFLEYRQHVKTKEDAALAARDQVSQQKVSLADYNKAISK